MWFVPANLDRLILTTVLVGTIAIGYGATTVLTSSSRPQSPWTIPEEGLGFAARYSSGEHLTAYVFVAAACGFSTEERTMDAIGRLPDSLRASHGESFSNISVIGVSVDQDVDAGLEYFRRMGKANEKLDQIAVGGSWLNDEVVNLVWRKGLAQAATPQVLLVGRAVDVEAYPGSIEVGENRKLLDVQGRQDIISWVNAGTPLDFASR